MLRIEESRPRRPPKKPLRKSSSVERAKVLYSYLAENDDELTLEEGDVILILEKELEDNGWWKGELNGKVGVFPDNFVELLPPEEKPRKPPPPAVLPAAASGKVKLSDKPPAPDPAKAEKSAPPEPVRPPKPKEEPREEKSGKGAATNLNKKPVAPPPVGKKPGRPADPKLIAQTDDHKAKESQKDVNNLDVIEPSEKLSHITANRVKAPQRRPPSSVHVKDQEDDETPPGSPRLKRPSSLRRQPPQIHDLDSEERVPPPRAARPPPPEIKDEPKLPLSPKSSPGHTSVEYEEPPSGVDNNKVEELKHQLEQLKANSVSRQKYDELHTQVQQLKDTIAQLKTSFNKRTLELMNEVDEEKKIRLNMQVELDRIKKLIAS